MAIQKQNIVVVDDDPSMKQALKRLLQAAGYDAEVYDSAEALLQSGGAGDAACLVFDIQLPGLSGIELLERLRETGTPPPVIFITAHDDPEVREEVERVGALAYLTKPFSGRSLLDAISHAFG